MTLAINATETMINEILTIFATTCLHIAFKTDREMSIYILLSGLADYTQGWVKRQTF
jgi:hypothetical protein